MTESFTRSKLKALQNIKQEQRQIYSHMPSLVLRISLAHIGITKGLVNKKVLNIHKRPEKMGRSSAT